MSIEDQEQYVNIPKSASIAGRFKLIWKAYGEKVTLAIGIALIAGVCFEAGYLFGLKNKEAPIALSVEAPGQADKYKNESVSIATEGAKSQESTVVANSSNDQKCALVASRNSTKYHEAACSTAQKIKAENRICFSAPEDAEKKGFTPAKCCHK